MPAGFGKDGKGAGQVAWTCTMGQLDQGQQGSSCPIAMAVQSESKVVVQVGDSNVDLQIANSWNSWVRRATG